MSGLPDGSVVTLLPDDRRVNDDDSGKCSLCQNPATVRVMHRCGVVGGDACVVCWRNHVMNARRLLQANPKSTIFCRHCCDPADDTQTVSMDHLYAVPL